MQVSYFGDCHRKSGTNGHLILCATFRSNFCIQPTNALSYARKTTFENVWCCRCDSIESSLCYWNSCSSFLTYWKSGPRVPHMSHIGSTACTVRRHVDRVMTFSDNSATQTHSQNLNLSAIRSFWLSLTKHLVMMGGLWSAYCLKIVVVHSVRTRLKRPVETRIYELNQR